VKVLLVFSSVTTRWKSACFRREAATSYPLYYRTALASSNVLYPPSYRRPLRVAFPATEEDDGLTMF